MGKNKKGGSSSHHSGDKHKREPTPPSEDFGDSEYSEESIPLRVHRLLPLPRRRLMTQTTPRGSPQRYGPTSGLSSAPGSRARMSQSTPRTRRTPRTRPRRAAAAMAVMATTTKAMVMVAEATARAVTAAAKVAAATVVAAARAAAGAATRPVARCHWF
jgi:hypothetical protein